ncbi:MAG: FtsQ-type POTRA domain-containing protein [Sinomonas sp.]|nr:FtsQ-type POTRA domain-containing protein [Sinomonas sp.]
MPRSGQPSGPGAGEPSERRFTGLPAPSSGDGAGSASSRVSLGTSSKVTVLRPVHDDARVSDEVDADEPKARGGAPDAGEAEGRASARSEPSPAPRRRRPWSPRRAERPSKTAATRSKDVLAFPVPRVKRIRRRAIIIGASTVAIVAALMAVLIFTPLLAVRTISVEGTKMVAPAQIQSVLAPLGGRPLPLVAPDEVSRLVAPIVQIKSVRTRAVPPNTLLVTVVERVPVALVKQADGFSVVVGDGVEIARTKDQAAYAVPVVDATGGPIAHPTFLAITSVLAALPTDILAQLATAKADSVDSVQLKLANGKTVIWGNAQDRDLKAKVLAALMKGTETPAKGQAPVSVYDVSVPRHPVTR